jgi:hypothetical protein
MIYRLLADLTLSIHLAFIVFVALGGLLVAWRRWIAWVHLPAAGWGALITFVGWRCPLTPLENRFRRLGGEAGYTESFIEHYIVPVVYPAGIGPTGWTALGVAVVVVNVLIYGWVYRRGRPTEERR